MELLTAPLVPGEMVEPHQLTRLAQTWKREEQPAGDLGMPVGILGFELEEIQPLLKRERADVVQHAGEYDLVPGAVRDAHFAGDRLREVGDLLVVLGNVRAHQVNGVRHAEDEVEKRD